MQGYDLSFTDSTGREFQRVVWCFRLALLALLQLGRPTSSDYFRLSRTLRAAQLTCSLKAVGGAEIGFVRNSSPRWPGPYRQPGVVTKLDDAVELSHVGCAKR